MIWILNKRILNRATKLLNTSIKILDGDLNARSNIKGSDELGSVGKTFDTMIEKLSNAIIDAQEKTKNESERYKQLQIEQTRTESEIDNKNKTYGHEVKKTYEHEVRYTTTGRARQAHVA